jgi:hypothetical protein
VSALWYDWLVLFIFHNFLLVGKGYYYYTNKRARALQRDIQLVFLATCNNLKNKKYQFFLKKL